MADHGGSDPAHGRQATTSAAANEEAAKHAPVSHAPASHESTEHGHIALGPVDWPQWIAGAIGVMAGLVMLGAFYLAGRG